MLEVAGPGGQPQILNTDEFKPPPDPETWQFPGEVAAAPVDPDLARIQPDRLPGPEQNEQNARSKKKRGRWCMMLGCYPDVHSSNSPWPRRS